MRKFNETKSNQPSSLIVNNHYNIHSIIYIATSITFIDYKMYLAHEQQVHGHNGSLSGSSQSSGLECT